MICSLMRLFDHVELKWLEMNIDIFTHIVQRNGVNCIFSYR